MMSQRASTDSCRQKPETQSDSGRWRTELAQFLIEKRPPTPCIILDLDIVRARYQALHQLLPGAQIYYAIKANPAPEIISEVAQLGSNFDLASSGEIDFCLGLNVPPERLSFGNTIKRESAIAKAWNAGIGLFAV